MKHPYKRRRESGLTWVEALIAVVVVAVLLALARPAIGVGLSRPYYTQMLSSMKMLQLATQQMAQDGSTTGDVSLSWPGTNGYAYWATNLVPSYLSTNDFRKLMSAPEDYEAGTMTKLRRWWAGPPGPASMTVNTNAVLVYAVGEDTDGKAIFLSSVNFSNTPTGGVFQSNVDLLNGRAFVVFHKAGDGAVLPPKQAGNTNMVGGYVPLCR